MQDVDRPAEIQPFAQPERARRPRMELKPLRLVLQPEGPDGIGGHFGWRRDVGKRSAVRAPEPESSVGLSIDLIALLVNRAVVPATLCRLRFYAALGLGLGGARSFVRGIIRAPPGTRAAGQPADSACDPRAAVPCARSRAP